MSDEKEVNPPAVESLVTETAETVPNVNQKASDVPRFPQQMAYHGEVHLDAAGQVTPGPKPPVRHELEVDEEGRKLREETALKGWPPVNVDLMRPVVPELPVTAAETAYTSESETKARQEAATPPVDPWPANHPVEHKPEPYTDEHKE